MFLLFIIPNSSFAVTNNNVTLDNYNKNISPEKYNEMLSARGNKDIILNSTTSKRFFDITFSTEKSDIRFSNDLITKVFIIGKSIIPEDVTMTFKIIDKNGNQVYEDKKVVTVDKDYIYSKHYDNMILPDGDYIAKLHTSYGDNVSDDFSSTFIVKDTSS